MYESEAKIGTMEQCEEVRSATRLEEALTRLSNVLDDMYTLDIETQRIKSGLIGNVPESGEKASGVLDDQGKLGELHDTISSIERAVKSTREKIYAIQTLV